MRSRRPRTPDAQRLALAARLLDAIAAVYAEHDLPLTVEALDAILPLVRHAQVERTIDAERRAAEERRARIAEWAAREDLVTQAALMAALGLSHREWRTAERLNLLREVPLPAGLRDASARRPAHSGYYRPVELDEDLRAAIAHETLLTANQAAEHLGISRGQFDYRRRTAGIEPAEFRTGGELWPFAVYRLADLERLRR